MRLFNALDGNEVKQIVLRDIGAAMDGNEQFQKHLTYPLIEWEWELKVRAHAQEHGEFGERAEGAVAVQQREPVAIVLKGGRSVIKSEQRPDSLAPDEAREAAGIPVLAPTVGLVGMVEAAPNPFDVALARRTGRPPAGAGPKPDNGPGPGTTAKE